MNDQRRRRRISSHCDNNVSSSPPSSSSFFLFFTPPTQNPSSSSSPRQQSTQTTISAHSEYTFHWEQKQNSHFLDLRRRIFRLRCPRDSIWKKRKKKSIIISDLICVRKEKKREKNLHMHPITHSRIHISFCIRMNSIGETSLTIRKHLTVF